MSKQEKKVTPAEQQKVVKIKKAKKRRDTSYADVMTNDKFKVRHDMPYYELKSAGGVTIEIATKLDHVINDFKAGRTLWLIQPSGLKTKMIHPQHRTTAADKAEAAIKAAA